jgi:predicted transcriptional regulator
MWFPWQRNPDAAPVRQFGKLEAEVMDFVWANGECTVRDVQAALSGRLAYTTLMTTLDRLYKKAILRRRKEGRAFFYSPQLNRTQYEAAVAQQLFDLALRADNSNVVLASFVDSVTEADHTMLDELDRLVKEKRRALRRKE